MHSDQNGILLIDKPTGMTSHDVVKRVRESTGVKCVGHAGTLDPLASGLLIVLVGRTYTKRQSEFLKADKGYECVLQLGVTTDTYDAAGVVLTQETSVAVNEATVKSVLARFRGETTQTVPAFSAVKVKGKELYKRAYQGKITPEMTLPQRQVVLHMLELVEMWSGRSKIGTPEDGTAQFIRLEVSCSAGTYIRSLAYDIGSLLGVGAAVVELRRIQSGDYTIADAVTLDAFCRTEDVV